MISASVRAGGASGHTTGRAAVPAGRDSSVAVALAVAAEVEGAARSEQRASGKEQGQSWRSVVGPGYHGIALRGSREPAHPKTSVGARLDQARRAAPETMPPAAHLPPPPAGARRPQSPRGSTACRHHFAPADAGWLAWPSTQDRGPPGLVRHLFDLVRRLRRAGFWFQAPLPGWLVRGCLVLPTYVVP